MQPGLSSRSELFDSLKVYLNNKNRLQPIIGLGSIIEYVKAGARHREASYLCEVCVCRLNKADMRNHIMGSLHRYNFIKAWHPQLVCEWKENSDLSRLAWPLMEIAKKIEGKEGSGDVQLIEVEDVLYQKMATLSENDAVTLIQKVRDWQGEPESHSQTTSVQLEQHSLQSQRTVLLGRNQLLRSERSPDADVISHKTSTQTNNPHLMHSSAAPTIKSEGWLTNTSTPQSNNIEVTVFSENSSSFLDGYTGTKPLIGLCRVVECRSDTGCTYVFLCHCCRVRSNTRDIIDHLTGSSHLINYLMETHPEQVEASPADINDNFLQSLAEKVEREEGRGELKVSRSLFCTVNLALVILGVKRIVSFTSKVLTTAVFIFSPQFLNILCSQVINAPESLCIPLTGKSYHWCMRMLCNGWNTSTQKKQLTVRGHRVNKTLVEGVTEKHAASLSKWMKSKTARRKKGKVADTLFKVSLPLTKGPVVLQRTSFSKDSLPVSPSPPPAPDLFPSPESDTYDRVSVCDAGSFAVDHTEHDLYSEDAEDSQYMVDGYSSYNEQFSHSKDPTEREHHKGYVERNYNRHQGFQERSRGNFDEGMATEERHEHTEELSAAVPKTYISCPPEMDYAEQWYHQQLLQNHHMAPDHMSPLTATVGRSGEVARRSDAAQIYMCPQLGNTLANSGSVAPETNVYYPGTEQTQVPTYMEFTAGNVQISPQCYMMHPLAYPGVQTGHRVMSEPSYGDGQTTKPEWYFPYLDSSGGGGMSWSNAFIPPVPSLYYETHSDFNPRDTRSLRVDDFQGWR